MNFCVHLGFSTLKVIHPVFLHLKSIHFGLHEEQQAEDEKILGQNQTEQLTGLLVGLI